MHEQPEENRPKPFSKDRSKYIIGMVIYFYCVFYIIMKVFEIFQGAATLPYLILIIPFVALAIIGNRLQRRQSFGWSYVVIGVLLISFMRYYELSLLQYLQEIL